MGNSKDDEKITLEIKQSKIKQLCKFLRKIEEMNQIERAVFFKKIPKKECMLISEIVTNLLYGRIKPDHQSFTLLKRCYKHLLLLASKKKSLNKKREVLKGVYGLQIISLILPLLKTSLNC